VIRDSEPPLNGNLDALPDMRGKDAETFCEKIKVARAGFGAALNDYQVG